MYRHPAFDRYQESYPRRSELHQNCYSRVDDEQSAAPDGVETTQTFEAAILLRDIPCRKRRVCKTTSRMPLPAPQKDLTAI
jgi:hypothetical protein